MLAATISILIMVKSPAGCRYGDCRQWVNGHARAPAVGEVRVRVTACGVCRTDLHMVDGELPGP
jgi:propanol-preferring alcohol dehydrogenase